MSSSKQQKRGSRSLRALLIALLLLVIMVAGISIFALKMRKSQSHDLQLPYASSMQGTDGDESLSGTADTFASKLVVSDANVPSSKVKLSGTRERGLLFNLTDKKAIFAQGIYDRVYPASITKIMTALLAVEHGNMDDQITITAEDVNLGKDSQMAGLRAGDVVTLQQLFSALLVYSANDAASAIARHIGGDTANFVKIMNTEAKRLGMTGTNFMNPHGLHDENHYTTPYDIYLMLNEAAKHNEITDVMKNSNYKLTIKGDDSRVYNLASTDKYLTGEHPLPDGVTIMAGKTGTTASAGSCLALAVQNRYGIPYIAIVMNAANKTVLYQDMDALLIQTNA